MKLIDLKSAEKDFFKGGNPLKKLLKVSLHLFEARQTGILYGTNHSHIKFLPTSMWDRGVMDRFDGRGIKGLILKLFGARIVTVRGLSPILFHRKDEKGNLAENDGVIAYVLRNFANYYKKGIRVIICPDTDRYIEKDLEPFLAIPFYVYNGKRICRSKDSIRVDIRIVSHFKSKNSIYIYLPDYGILVINTADVNLLKLENGAFENETELIRRLDALIAMVEVSSLAYLGQLTGKKGAQLLWRKEKHLRQTSHELIENEKRYRDLYDNAPIAYISLDPDGHILNCNQKAREFSGYRTEELIGLNAKSLFVQDTSSKNRVDRIFSDLLKGKELKGLEVKVTVANKESVWVNLSVDCVRDIKGGIVELRMMILDVSKRKMLEQQLIQSQKMEAIGTLAGGIAHDFNNILSPISGYTEMLLMDTSENDPGRNNLKIIMDCVNHAKNLVNQILTFSRHKDHTTRPLNLVQAIEESLTLIRSVLPSTIKLTTRIDQNDTSIMADPIQFHQVIMNLVTNAYQSMKNSSKGNLEIELHGTDPPDAKRSYPSEKWVKLSVKDTGSGIKKEIFDRIFDPYFSTKPEGEGSGIGLSVVLAIVDSHDGVIRVDSTEGIGTRFDVYFPVCRTECADEVRAVEKIQVQNGTERILLVDDDKKVAVMQTHMLEKLGYSVTCFTSSLNAMNVFKSNPHLFDLILTDMTMPDLTGVQLADRIYRIKPDIPVILCTGFGDTIEKSESLLPCVKALLKKPVAVKELSCALRQALSPVSC